ncbi:MAG: transposase [Solirubrobacterales bacterium]
MRRRDLAQAKERLGSVLERFQQSVPKVAELLEAAEEDLLAFCRFPASHWRKLRSTSPLERVNKEIVAVTSSAHLLTTPRRSARSERC